MSSAVAPLPTPTDWMSRLRTGPRLAHPPQTAQVLLQTVSAFNTDGR